MSDDTSRDEPATEQIEITTFADLARGQRRYITIDIATAARTDEGRGR